MKRTLLMLAIILYILTCAIIIYALQAGGVRLLFITVIFISGAFLGWLLWWLNGNNKLTISNILVVWLVVNGTSLLWGVMYLAVTNHGNIAETLGRYIVTELLGTIGVSLAKSMVENLSQHNTWPDKKIERDL